ncbi:class D sortase [Pueribacillus theae]|uniref:Class D sortase n=1 Tax=Pueribacillus theae TaxID=2171751 RepID=A0A2U1JTK7_9BACI|nr:class D sortase [Pueribacillus theae]PWA08269.1 class D sortase [Pueribacillus theae]
MKAAAIMLIAAGIVVMFYPFLNHLYAAQKEKELMQEWETGQMDAARESFIKLDEVYREKEQEEKDTQSGSPIGMLTIDKIDLTLPILDGADQANLRVAAGKLEGTDHLEAKTGNTAIAAHRSYTYGKQFNRLDEVEVGDEIIVHSTNNKKTYTVFNKIVVEPTDVSVLESKAGEKMITLITCEPIRKATHRLIVQAR